MGKLNRPRRIPEAVDGIQVNFCKNPHCLNFGVPAPEVRGAVKDGKGEGSYTLSSKLKQIRTLLCHFCNRSTVLRSNFGIAQELTRFSPTDCRNRQSSCTNQTCKSFGLNPMQFPSEYYRHGTTSRGEPRFRCKSCGATFSNGAPIRVQRRPELNGEVLKLLVNKMPMRRICEVLEIPPSTLYSKLRYLNEVMGRYAAEQEAGWLSTERAPSRAYVSIDRQDYSLNWGTQFDRRNIVLGATAAAENTTGYVLGAQLNFDSSMNAEDVEADAIRRGDYDVPPAYRYYARLCLRKDFDGQDTGDGKSEIKAADLSDDFGDEEFVAPHSGMLVHLSLTQYALMFHIKRMLCKVERVRLFVDRDPGLDSACMGVFAENIRQRRVDVFVVKTAKQLTMQGKKLLIAQSMRELRKFEDASPHVEKKHLVHQFVKHFLQSHRKKSEAGSWFNYPISDMADPQKSIQFQTDFRDYDIDRLSYLYMRATLRGVDRFFMQVRRRISVLERPLATANNANRRWHGYGAYSPLVTEQVLNIFRVYYNFFLVGEDGKTPAMRIGIATKPATASEIF